MLSIRSFARSAPRAVSRLAISSTRQPSSLRQISRLQSAFSTPARSQFSRAAFSTTVRRSKNEGDEELVQKLESEIQAEEQMKEADGVPTSVKEFLENGPFELVDTPGTEEVVLTRTFSDEKIKISFSIADLNNLDPDEQYNDRAMEDEEDIDAQGSSKVPEDSLDAEEADPDHGSEEPTSFPARLNIVIEKASKGAIAVEAICEEGVIVVDNVYYYADAAHAHAKTAEVAHKRQDLYVGPPFGNLDEDLQVLLERYLDERGINSTLAVFVPDYIDMKEQKEYLQWLENVKSFVEA